MSDIFISYSQVDKAIVQTLVNHLQEQGWSVFWDRDIPVGETWRSYIGEKLSQARCVVVVWSSSSVTSQWVLEEAEEAKNRGALFPISLDGTSPPFGFGAIHCANLKDWSQDDAVLNQSEFRVLLDSLSRYLNKPQAISQPYVDAMKIGRVDGVDGVDGVDSNPVIPQQAVTSATNISEDKKPSTKQLEGISGWLLIPVITLVGYVFIKSMQLYSFYTSYTSGALDQLTMKEGKYYSTWWEITLSMQVVFNLFVLVASVVLLVLVYRKMKVFPKLMIYFYFFTAAINAFSMLAIVFLLDDAEMESAITVRDNLITLTIGSIIAAFFWTAYLRMSKRVKNTFIN